MTEYKYTTLLTELRDRILTITLNRPERLNAVDATMHADLEDAFAKIAGDPEIAVVLLTGAGKGFCAGGDVKGFAEGKRASKRVEGIGIVSQGGRRIIHNMLWVEQPIICAVNGVAAGLGATIALFCDVVYASDKARIGDTHVRAGLVAGDGGCVIWPLLIGISKAKEYLMTGDLIDAFEAERIGLINKVVPHEELLPAAKALASRLAKGPTLAIRGTKHTLNRLVWNELNRSLDIGLVLESKSIVHPDHAEAAKAFVEKRAPVFTGTI